MNNVLALQDATVIREGKSILGPLSWTVASGERWVILGPNGAGKSTLFSLVATQIHPSRGKVEVLDTVLGKVDVFEVRPRIGFVSTTLTHMIPQDERVIDLVMSSAYAIVGRWQESYDLWDESRAISLLTVLGVRGGEEASSHRASTHAKSRTLTVR